MLTTMDRRLPRFLRCVNKTKAEHIQKWYKQMKYQNDGFAFYYDQTRKNKSYPYPKNHYTVGEYIYALSLKLHYLYKILFRYLFRKTRSKLLIFVQ